MTLPETPMHSEWHYSVGGQRFGPVSEAAMVDLVRQGTLDGQSLVWSASLPDWQPLATTTLATALGARQSPPPLTGSGVKNELVWILAFAPLLGLVLQGVLSGLTGASLDTFWFATLLLNILLSTADEKRLVAAGHDTARMGAAWLIPVYLYKRADVLRHQPSYFAVWCVTFLLSFYL